MFDPTGFPAVLALLGVVLLVAGLLSGIIERSGTPQVAVFLGLGAAIGPYGLKLLDVGIDSGALEVVAKLSLALVLFTEALTLDFAEVRRHAKLATIILVPGTLLSTAIIATGAAVLLGVSIPLALMIGAALASTDPVLLRALLRWRGLPSDTRLALRLESGLNDIVLLPIIYVAIAIAHTGPGQAEGLGSVLLKLFLLGPAAGVMIGFFAVSALLVIRKKVGIRRDYESLFSIGVCFVAFGAAESMHASGFVAAFAAGATIAALDVELCDCFLEYGETTAELAMLFAFVLLGTSLAWSGFAILSWPIVLFVILALAARPAALWLATRTTEMDGQARKLLAWFGPRGLSSILLILLPVFEGVPGTEHLFHISAIVMIVSIVLHGGSVMRLSGGKRGEASAAAVLDVAPPVSPTPVTPHDHVAETPTSPSLSIEGLPVLTFDEFLAHGREERLWLLDGRSARGWASADTTAQGAARIDPDQPTRSAEALGIPKDGLLGIYCACPAEETSLRVAEALRSSGWRRAYALKGGWDVWVEEGRPTAPIV
ncbi:hypothetical protein EON81_07445 [bacterium]|nr:MAG: hypothetical protein EON81_07445 [bacterium]